MAGIARTKYKLVHAEARLEMTFFAQPSLSEDDAAEHLAKFDVIASVTLVVSSHS
jgi:hypothetical protein